MRVVQKKLKGSVLGFSLMLLSLLLFSGITLVSVSVLERKASFATQKSVIAFQAADSGMERILKRIYIDNSPTLGTVPLNGAMPDIQPHQLANNLPSTNAPDCNDVAGEGVITGDNTANPVYSFRIILYDASGNSILCNNAQWRDRVIKIRSEGFFQRTSRVIEAGIRPRE